MIHDDEQYDFDPLDKLDEQAEDQREHEEEACEDCMTFPCSCYDTEVNK
jgi:hypothetical protein